MSEFSQREFRQAMGQFCTGVVVVTGRDAAGAPVGFSAQSFVSVSLDPPLIAVCPAGTSKSWPLIRNSGGRFGINILAADQQDLCLCFARSGGDKFCGLNWKASVQGGVPVLDRVLGFIECSMEVEYPVGDHVMVIGRVHELQVRPGQHAPLLFFRGSYGAFGDLPELA